MMSEESVVVPGTLPRRLWLATLVIGALIDLVWALRRWRAYHIDRGTEARPRATPSRAVAYR